MKRTIALAIMAVLLLTVVAAAQEKGAAKKAAGKADATEPKQAAEPAAVPEEYVIGPEDVLHINVWKEAELTTQVIVRPDGKVSLPLLNDVQAAGVTPMRLASQIADKLKQYVTDPRVTVTVVAMNSHRIFVMGEFGRTGPIPMLPNMTLLQAISAAGGFSQYANVKKMYVLRNENGRQTKLPVNYKALLNGDASQNYPMKPGDTLVLP